MKRRITVFFAGLLLAASALSPMSAVAQEEVDLWGFIFPEFKDAEVLMKDRSRLVAPVNYDAVYDQMLAITDAGEYIVMDAEDVMLIIVDKRVFLPVKNHMFYEEIPIANSRRMYVQHKTDRVNTGVHSQTTASQSVGYISGGTSQGGAPSAGNRGVHKIENDQDWKEIESNRYFIREGMKFYRVVNPKSLGKVFPKHKDEINDFSAQNDIHYNNIADVQKIIEYCYSLE